MVMKKRLSLRKVTIRNLDESELNKIAGCDTNTCGNTCAWKCGKTCGGCTMQTCGGFGCGTANCTSNCGTGQATNYCTAGGNPCC